MSLHEVWDSYLLDTFKQLRGSSSWGEVFSELVGMIADSPDIVAGALLDAGQLQSAGSMIASETATTVTCVSAYKSNEQWLKSGGSLDEEYLVDRAGVAVYRLMRAGIRLAQVLDAVATSFYVQERVEEESAPSVRGSSVQANRFSLLALNSGRDDQFQEVITDDPIGLEEALSQTATQVFVSATTRSPAEKRAAKSKAKRLRDRILKRSVEGVDMESIVLIKRERDLYVTYRHLVESDDWSPPDFFIEPVQFFSSQYTQPFCFDSEVFTADGPLSANLREVTLMHLRRRASNLWLAAWVVKLTLDGVSINPFGVSTLASVNNFLRPLQSNDIASASSVMLTRMESQADEIVAIAFGALGFVLRAKDALDPANLKWVFNEFESTGRADASSQPRTMLVDTRIVDGNLTSEEIKAFQRLEDMPQNRELLEIIRARNPPLLRAMFILGIVGGVIGDRSTASLYVVAAFSEINEIPRPGFPGFTTREFVLRDTVRMTELVQRLNLPSFSKFRAMADPSVETSALSDL
jgi:hypothetical protein